MLSGYPLLSIVTGVVLTTVILAVLYLVLKRRYELAGDRQAETVRG